MPDSKVFAVYIMTNDCRTVLYVGVTSNLENRATQHRESSIPGFTKTYNLRRLVWYRTFEDARDAIDFEKRLKRWRRAWKVRLIEESNPEWRDLWPELMGLDLQGPLAHLQGGGEGHRAGTNEVPDSALRALPG